jgi:hypothetical protein
MFFSHSEHAPLVHPALLSAVNALDDTLTQLNHELVKNINNNELRETMKTHLCDFIRNQLFLLQEQQESHNKKQKTSNNNNEDRPYSQADRDLLFQTFANLMLPIDEEVK